MDAIERIEIAVRVDLAYTLGAKDQFAHRNAELLHGHFSKKINSRTGLTKHQEWLNKLDKNVKRSREEFIQHYRHKYELPLPIWMSVELWDFGLLSNFYKGLKVTDKAAIAEKYNIPVGNKISSWELMESWLRCLNYVRNVAAHHSRLWNKNLVDQPKLPELGVIDTFDHIHGKVESTSRIYIIFCIVLHLMKQISLMSAWPQRLIDFIHKFPNVPELSVADMGFPINWQSLEIWQFRSD